MEEPEGPWDTRVTSLSDRAVLAGHGEITGCHLEPMLDPVPALQRSITLTLIKCPPFLFTSCFQPSEHAGLLLLLFAVVQNWRCFADYAVCSASFLERYI